MAQYWEYLRWGLYAASALSAGRLFPLAVLRLVAAFTHSEERHKHCMEVLRLARHDAAEIPPYVYASWPVQSPGPESNRGPSPDAVRGALVRGNDDLEEAGNVPNDRVGPTPHSLG